MSNLDYETLEKELVYKRKNGFRTMSDKEIKIAFDFAEKYKDYLNSSKTEREAVKTSVEMAKREGFVEWESEKTYKEGDKIYFVNRNKAVILVKFGKMGLEKGVNISVAHVDCPRLDLKPNPVYENESLVYFDTHYYGGIKKYQWVTLPLALHGIVVKQNGEKVEICVGENPDEPVFYITDLLPHLGAEQMKKSLGEAITGEALNVLVGSACVKDEKISNAVKLNTLKILKDKYGITEGDFMSAELTLVPADKARDIGFDRSLIASYGHDDRVCAYPSLLALFDAKDIERTAVVCLTDKEEIGSMGNTGLESNYLFDFIEDLAVVSGVNPRTVFRNSKCLSADVNAAYDPAFSEVYEKNNSSYINCGLVVTKYTGARGKSGSSDATAEFVGEIRRAFDENDVLWQMGELGKVDIGGGGTVAKYVANRNIDVVDVGVPVLSMHAPCEAVSKIDVYSTYKGILTFFEKIV